MTATISERLRTAITEDVTFNFLAVTAEEAADIIDALVSALEAARGAINDDKGYEDVAEIKDAALALARKGGE